ncbi:MAG TPA: DUF5916 domain-containing protein [Vicinamibacterales bacterium]|nr:DUF5916 domain-containing protein [Vicinamibacterales bacterium]
MPRSERKRRVSSLIAILVLLIAAPDRARGQQESPVPGVIRVPRVERAPTLDGRLDEEAWQRPPIPAGDWVGYTPRRGERLPHRTEVWIAHDDTYIYLAFRCTDPDPGKIKTGVRRRDAISADDWVLVSVDPAGTRQAVYQMQVNASGVQADAVVNSAASASAAPDWVWDSEARLTPAGYDVEMRLPFASLPFQGGRDVRVGAWFARGVSRLGASVSWPDVPAGRSELERHVPLLFDHIPTRRTVDVIPATTYSARQSRDTAAPFGGVDDRGDLGVSLKYRVSASATVEAAVNPDFSQVESDAPQVEVNRRFPPFYPEKRPFFMEGIDVYQLPEGPHSAVLRTPVHTRRIVDPHWGTKVTGSSGRFTYAGLAAGDAVPQPDGTATRAVGAGRAQYSLGTGNYAGAILTTAEGAGRTNRVGGGDVTLALDAHQRVSGWLLYSDSREDGGATRGAAAMAKYTYTTRRVFLEGAVQHVGTGFATDVGFIDQAGLTRVSAMSSWAFYPEVPWLRRFDAWVLAVGDRDRLAGGDGHQLEAAVGVTLNRQSRVNVYRTRMQEPWAGRLFDRETTRFTARSQIVRWCRLEASGSVGDAIYYDEVTPFAGRAVAARAAATLQPTPRFSQALSVTDSRFERANGESVYHVTLIDARTLYQFTKRFFLRSIVQYDGGRRRVLTDALASYELRPGTVVFAGYGSLLEPLDRVGDDLQARRPYRTTTRGVYFKLSYLLRL